MRNSGKLLNTGEIKINGSLVQNSDEISGVSGYVQQG